MKKVKYTGELPALIPTLGLEVKNGDVIDVPDDFNNVLFTEVATTVADKPSTSKSSNTKEANN